MGQRQRLDPARMRFSMSEPRKLREDDHNAGVNCWGCIFWRQPSAVCMVAAEEAIARRMRDCDAVDPFGEVVIYVKYNEQQLELLREEPNADQES